MIYRLLVALPQILQASAVLALALFALLVLITPTWLAPPPLAW